MKASTYDTGAIQRLDQADRVIQQFIRSCSHSMRGPVKSIKGLARLLEDERIDPGQVHELSGLIEKTTDKLDKVLTDLEQFMQDHVSRSSLREVSLEQLIHRAIAIVKRNGFDPAIQWHVQIDQQMSFRTDPSRVLDALVRIIENAVRYQRSDNNDKRISVVATGDALMGLITVEDNGSGIPEAVQDELFDPFSRGNDKSGFGVGLFVAQEAVSSLGGELTFQSVLGKGSSFTLRIPNRPVSQDN